MSPRAVITGAFSYTGAAVAAELLGRGWQVHTLTNRTGPQGSPIGASPLRFEPEHLRRELTNADAFINTYWIRLPHAGQTFASAVGHSAMLLQAAVAAKVGKVVLVSGANPQEARAGDLAERGAVHVHLADIVRLDETRRSRSARSGPRGFARASPFSRRVSRSGERFRCRRASRL